MDEVSWSLDWEGMLSIPLKLCFPSKSPRSTPISHLVLTRKSLTHHIQCRSAACAPPTEPRRAPHASNTTSTVGQMLWTLRGYVEIKTRGPFRHKQRQQGPNAVRPLRSVRRPIPHQWVKEVMRQAQNLKSPYLRHRWAYNLRRQVGILKHVIRIADRVTVSTL